MTDTKKKINSIRKLLTQRGQHAFIVPMNDEFLNEYIADYARRVEWLSGFTGSAGSIVITTKKAAFFTDGRYILQAAKEIDKSIFEINNISDITTAEWLLKSLKSGAQVAFDPWLITEAAFLSISHKLASKKIKLSTSENLVDLFWQDKPEYPKAKVRAHPVKFSGEDAKEKIKRIVTKIKNKGASATLITLTDSICWLLNIRGSDISHTPVTLAFLILETNGKVQLFIDKGKISPQVKRYLGSRVTIHLLEDIIKKLTKYSSNILVDPNVTAKVFFDAINSAKGKAIKAEDPIQLEKALKNKTEIAGAKNMHIRDGASVTKFIYWLKNNYKKLNIDELAAEQKLFEFRKNNQHFMDLSFPTICGFNSNGAIVHYRSSKKTSQQIKGNGILLVDSGAQYLDGTTDITRSIAISTPTAEQKRNFTYVLKGHIAIATLKFPEGTNGGQIDALARANLWNAGLDYDHGTGHGVGSYLSVHEGPQRISKISNVPLRPGMILSNEPGFYKDEEYGIRIENLVLVVETKIKYKNKKFFAFETLTAAPFDIELIEKNLLTKAEIDWVNEYHQNIYKKTASFLHTKEKEWLKKQKI